MKSVSLNVYPRTLARRGAVKKLRSSGRIPAVIYGRNTNPQSLEIDLKELENAVHQAASENLLVDLSVQGGEPARRLALVQEVQHHVLSGHILHLDLHEVKEDEKVVITVPVEAVGEAAGVKNGGGVLEHVIFKIKVRALPKDLPETIHVDVSKLEIGQAIHLGEIPTPEGVEILGLKHLSVFAVAAPLSEAAEAAATDAAAAGPAEPEMIKEKKEDPAAADAKGGDKKAGDKKK